MEVVVPDDSLSIAIGKQGQNVRLASRLSGWHLDVISETRYDERLQHGFDSLMSLPNMTEALANLLFEKGYFSPDDVSKALAEELAQEINISVNEARDLIEAASNRQNQEAPEARDTEEQIPEDREENTEDKKSEEI
jgi:N utilization substance protein A